jgi:hypothetical protein
MPSIPRHIALKRSHGCRLETETTLWGYRALVLQNELLRVTVLVGRGADIVEFLYKPLDIDFMWASPGGQRPRDSVYPPQDPKNCFGDYYAGGWQELFPHGSRTVEAYGADLYQHGEVWGLPWDVRVDEDRPERVSVTLTVRTRQLPFVLERRMSLTAGSPVLELDESAHNLGRFPLEIMWGHHPAFGAPFLSPDCRLYAPTTTLNYDLKGRTTFPAGEWKGKREDYSKVPGPSSGLGRMLYLEKLRDGWYALVNPKLKVGFGMRWDVKRFPVVWIYQQCNAAPRSPHFGNGYMAAVEPFSHLPFARERNEKLLKVPAGGTLNARFQAFAIPGGKPVRNIDAQCRAR